jgi:DNA-binding NarL/FixJ family response regulator
MTALTLRESEVMDLLAEGLSREQIAHRLGLSLHTVQDYTKAIRAKYEAPNLTVAAYRHGCRRWSPSAA